MGPGVSIALAARTSPRGRSKEAARLFHDLVGAPPRARRGFMRTLTPADWVQVLAVASREGGTPYAIWRDDPVGFVTDVLRENTWSKPREILSALPRQRYIAVPSCFSSGKTWSSARALLWFTMVHPPGRAQVITMAPTWRQVARLLWSEVRYAHARAGLPGHADMVQLRLRGSSGKDFIAAYGLSGAPTNEASVQGIHSPNLLLIVDEAGGIGHPIGNNLRGMTSTEGSHMLAIGNPPSDEEGSWFEGLCTERDDEVHVIQISAYDTPSLSGEQAPLCRSCTGDIAHPVTKHLVTTNFVTETIREHGEDSNYVQAKVHARFPKGGPNRVLPSVWVDNAAAREEPEAGTGVFALNELGLPEETLPWLVRENDWIRLGVDVAAGGGDEFVVARAIGDLVTIQHTSSGPATANSNDVAGVVLAEIRRAEAVRRAIGTKARIRVKIDVIGVGHGVYSTLLDWSSEGKGTPLHDAVIVPVQAAEATNREPDGATLMPRRKRDEMWLAMRSLLQPDREHDSGRLRLRLDGRTLAQLRAPTMGADPSGYTVVERKDRLKVRGLTSPDRAEACLMAVYEPLVKAVKKKAELLV